MDPRTATSEVKRRASESKHTEIVPVFSIGQLFNSTYKNLVQQQQTDVEPVSHSNALLLNYIESHIRPEYVNPVLLSASTYQSSFLDNQGSLNNYTGLFSDALLVIAQEIANRQQRNTILDEFLLGNIFVDSCPEERSKLLLLYAQMQRLSSLNQNKRIHFHFIDVDENVINKLNEFFQRYPQFKPGNIDLYLVHNEGEKLSLQNILIGEETSQTDHYYPANIQQLDRLFHKAYPVAQNKIETNNELLKQVSRPASNMISKLLPQRPPMIEVSAYNTGELGEAIAAQKHSDDEYKTELETATNVIHQFEKHLNENRGSTPAKPLGNQQIVKFGDSTSALEKAKRMLHTYRANRLGDKRGEYFSFFGKYLGMSRTLKETASKKILDLLCGKSDVTFSENEIDALRNGRLSKAIATFENDAVTRDLLAPFISAERNKMNKLRWCMKK